MWAIPVQIAASASVAAAGGRGSLAVLARQGRGGRGRGDPVEFATRSRKPPAVLRLARDEVPLLLPWSGCGERLIVEVGDLEACVSRVAMSLVACALVYNVSIELASVAGFYWAWAPMLSTALPNMLLRLRYGYAGIWSAQILQVRILDPPKFTPDDREGIAVKIFNRVPPVPSTLQLEIGDGSPATFTMEIPLSDEMPEVQAGDRVELMVVSDEPSLSRFKVLRDLYLPERQAWISEEPCIEREPFEELQRSLNPPGQSNGSEEDLRRSLNAPGQLNGSEEAGNGRRTQLFLEENASSRDRASWEKALRRGQQSGRPRDFDYVMDSQERKYSKPANQLDQQSGRVRDSDSIMDVQEKYRRRAKDLDDDDL